MKRMFYFILSIILCFTNLVFVGCSDRKISENNNKKTIRIAYQYGIAYAPAEIMQYKKTLEDKLPNVKIEWVVQSSGAAINEGIISGDIDVAMMGVAPFLIGWDKGIPYKMYSPISSLSMGLVTYDPNIKSIKDIKDGDKIAVPSIGSMQQILLAMACEKQLGNIHALDKNLVNMSHPDAYQALLSESDVKLHFASPPYLNKEIEKGYTQILSGKEAIGGEYTQIVGVASTSFYKNNPDLYKAVYEATQESIEYLNINMEGSAEILAEVEKDSKEKMLSYLQNEKGNYNNKAISVLEMADFMKRANYISKSPSSVNEIQFDKVS